MVSFVVTDSTNMSWALPEDFTMRLLKTVLFVTALALPAVAHAYSLKGEGCEGNGNACQVYCDNGILAGEMYWNGSVWTDGVKWSEDKDTEARKICAANGADCQ